MDDSIELYYKGCRINPGMKITKEVLDVILTQSTIDKFVNEEDCTRLATYLPANIPTTKENIKNLLFNTSKFTTPVDLFKSSFQRGFFNETYQKYLGQYEVGALEDLIEKYKGTLKHLEKNIVQISAILNERVGENGNGNDIKSEESQSLKQVECDYDINSSIASSGYSSLYSDEDKEADQFDFGKDKEQLGESKSDTENPMEGIFSNERFKNLKISKNQLTIRPRSKEELKDFQKQEFDRYKNPHLPWRFVNSDGTSSVVAPVLKKMPSNSSSKPRDHVMLKPDRPSYVTILSLVRDAASRLMDGVGTRADICDLLKDSQYINEHLSDSQINNIVSGALDRLHYEKDPCVKYDLQRKLWIYLHKNRQPDHPSWIEHLKKSEKHENEEKGDKKEKEKEKDNACQVLDLQEDEDAEESPIIKESVENNSIRQGVTHSNPHFHHEKSKKKGEKMLKSKRRHPSH